MRENLLNELEINEYEYKYALPSTIFEELVRLKEEGTIKAVHLPVTFSYLFFTGYMYRFAKYNKMMVSATEIKEILGFTSTNKSFDYLIKKDGVLDTKGYTENTSDFPIDYSYTDNGLEIPTISSLPKEDAKMYRDLMNVPKRFAVKKPLYGFECDSNDLEMDLQGTFFDSKMTILLDIRVFDYCMKNDELGVNAFYIYAYLQHMNNFYNGYDASHIRLADELGLSKGTIQKYRDAMRSYNMIYLVHNMEYFHPQMNSDKMKVSSNHINDFELFTREPQEYNKFKRIGEKKTGEANMNVVETEAFVEPIVMEQIKVEINIEELPY